MTITIEANAVPRDLFQIAQFSERNPFVTQAAMRAHILNARDRLDSRGQVVKGNGLAEAGAIIRLGRRVLVSESKFFAWLAAQQNREPTHRKRRGAGTTP